MTLENRRLVIYHGDCVDGFTAAWACHRLYGDGPEYFAAKYAGDGADDALPDVTGRDVVMVDYCTGRDQLLRLYAQARRLVVLDHHKTAEAACAGLDFCVFDMERSGAGLAWDELINKPRPWLIDYVEDRDLWRFALPDSKAVNAFVAVQPMTFENWDRLLSRDVADAATAGRGVLSFIDRYVHAMALHARRIVFAGYRDIPIVNAPYVNTSELVGHLAEGALFAVGWFQRGDGMYQYSLRSRGDFDVSALAQRYGGGGHKSAAGFSAARRVADR